MILSFTSGMLFLQLFQCIRSCCRPLGEEVQGTGNGRAAVLKERKLRGTGNGRAPSFRRGSSGGLATDYTIVWESV